MSRRVSTEGLEFIKQWEGFAPKAYQDIAGHWTIGYGHRRGFQTGVFDARSVIDEAAGGRLLREDLARYEARIVRLTEIDLAQHEFDALVSFDFNTGGYGRSTVRRRLNQRDRQGAADALLWWNKATVKERTVEVLGLTRRRRAERALFLGVKL